MPNLLQKAKEAHADHHAKRQSRETEAGAAQLKHSLKHILNVEAAPVGNRHVHDGITFTCHADGALHVVHRCEKCGWEVLSRSAIRAGDMALVDLHAASTQPIPSHPPCNGASAVMRSAEAVEPAEAIA